MTYFLAYFHPGAVEILKSWGPAFLATAATRGAHAPASVCPPLGRPRAWSARVPGLRPLHVTRAPARRAEPRAGGAGGEGRPVRVGDTRWGGEARRPHPALGRNRPGVASAASGASGEETRAPADQHHHPATALLLCVLAALRAAALAPASTPGPSLSPTPDARPPCRARSVQNGRGGEARPRDPSAPPAQSPVWASPGSPSLSPSRPALASASALSGAPSASQHELQRRLQPADQHAGPHDPRRVRPRPALRHDRRRGRQQRWWGHQQDVLLPALHGHRPELGWLLVGTGPTRSARCAWAGGPGSLHSPSTLGPGRTVDL